PGHPSVAVRQDVTIHDLRGKLVPVLLTPYQVDGIRVAYDSVDGTVLRPDGLGAGVTYQTLSRPTSIDVNLLPVAQVPTGDAVASLLTLGAPAPDELRGLADSVAAGASDPYRRAFALAQFLSGHYALAADAPSGHSLADLTSFLLGDRRLGGQRGSSE